MLKSLRVLMIGNSFSISVGKHLPQVVRSVQGVHLSLTSMYIGGCSLQRHWENVLESRQDSYARQYDVRHWDSEEDACNVERGNIQEQLSKEWDVVTLQQASHESWRRESYQPYLDNLIALVKTTCPRAEIMLQQTWAYRNSDDRIAPGNPGWGFDQLEMYNRLTSNYGAFAKEYNLRMIPTGAAVQLTRKGNAMVFPTLGSIPQGRYSWPDLPPQAHEVVGAYRWRKNDDGKLVLTQDAIHLNPRGEYLQACVWFATLYGMPTSCIGYVPEFMDVDDAAFLRECAQAAVMGLHRQDS